MLDGSGERKGAWIGRAGPWVQAKGSGEEASEEDRFSGRGELAQESS